MNSTRRQFVAVTLAAMPALSSASAATRTQKPAAGNDDPVWAQIQEELNRLQKEIKNKKPTPQTIRAFESTLRFHSAHASSKGHEQLVAQSVRRQIREKGRAAFLADAIDMHREHERHAQPRVDSLNRLLPPRPEPTVDELGAVADGLMRGNYVSVLRHSADAARRLAEGLPAEPAPGVRLVARRGTWPDYCGDAGAIVDGLTALKDLICVLAFFDPPMFMAECVALQMEVWLLESLVWFFCTVL